MLTKFFFLSLIFLSIIHPVYGEIQNIEIDWLIEGEPSIDDSPKIPETSKSIIDDKNISEQNMSNKENEIFTEFITNSQYFSGEHSIDINSKEGQMLNKLLIEQSQLNKESFFHMIKYLDRYSDGYIELAESLLDPVSIQNYHINGKIYDSNIDSNLAYFLLERGYSLDDLKSIPNDAFNPTKYDQARAMAAQIQNENRDSVDLRDLIPNYTPIESEDMKEKMINDMSKQTIDVFDSILSDTESSLIMTSELTEELFNEQFNTRYENTKQNLVQYENTKHGIFENPPSGIELFETDSTQSEIENYVILILIPIIIGVVISVYVLRNRPKQQILEPILNTFSKSVNYQKNTESMLNSAITLFQNHQQKEAYEKFSQAIRYYYSHKLSINLEMTAFEMIHQLEKHPINNFKQVKNWLMLCGQVEFTKYATDEKKFTTALAEFSKLIS